MTNSSRVRAILDADVLYRAAIRDILLQLAKDDLFEAKWTVQIHEEWMEALAKNRPDIARSRIERLRNKMDAETRDPLVFGFESIVEGLYLPEDPNDRHVLAAAIVGKCSTIITINVGHFPAERLEPFGIIPQHPDTFLLSLFAEDREAFCAAVRTIRARLTKPPLTVEEYLTGLAKAGAVATAFDLQQYAPLLERPFSAPHPRKTRVT